MKIAWLISKIRNSIKKLESYRIYWKKWILEVFHIFDIKLLLSVLLCHCSLVFCFQRWFINVTIKISDLIKFIIKNFHFFFLFKRFLKYYILILNIPDNVNRNRDMLDTMCLLLISDILALRLTIFWATICCSIYLTAH